MVFAIKTGSRSGRMMTSLAIRTRCVTAASVAMRTVASWIGAYHWTWSPTCRESNPTSSTCRASAAN